MRIVFIVIFVQRKRMEEQKQKKLDVSFRLCWNDETKGLYNI